MTLKICQPILQKHLVDTGLCFQFQLKDLMDTPSLFRIPRTTPIRRPITGFTAKASNACANSRIIST